MKHDEHTGCYVIMCHTDCEMCRSGVEPLAEMEGFCKRGDLEILLCPIIVIFIIVMVTEMPNLLLNQTWISIHTS